MINSPIIEIMPLETERLKLEPISVHHSKELYTWMKDPLLSEYLTWPPHTSENQTKAVIESLIDQINKKLALHWSVKFESRIVGLVSLIDIRTTQLLWTLNRAEIAYWIAPMFQKRGLATEACAALIEFAFNQCYLHKLKIAYSSNNLASAAVVSKLPFLQIGEERDAFYKNGQWHNLIHFEILKADYKDNTSN